ncbi:hypothetical protein BHE74_00028774 [Ensete ventricosum]|nr:hypothetical protein BHE74_00028774 [Ensete ventricosum]
MQGEGGVEDVYGCRRKKSAVERAGHAGSVVGPLLFGRRQSLFQATAAQLRREKLEEDIEVVAREVGEDLELGGVAAERRVHLRYVLDDDAHEEERVGAAGTAQVCDGKRAVLRKGRFMALSVASSKCSIARA